MLVRKDSALGWARMSLLALALVVLMAQLVSTPASAQPVAPVTPEQPPVGVAPEEPAGQQYGPASEEKSPVDSAVEEDETPSPEGSVISIRCAPGYELVEGEDPSGREDACIPEDGKDAVSEDAQADKLPEEIAPAKEDASGEGAATAAGVPPSPEDGQGYDQTVYGCPGGYVYDESDDMCEPDEFGFFDPLFVDGTVVDSAGKVVAWYGNLPADLLKIIGFGVEGAFVNWIGEPLSDLGEQIGGPFGWPLQGAGAVFSFTGHAFGAVVGPLGQVVGYVSDGAGEVIDSDVDAVGDAADEVASWFGW